MHSTHLRNEHIHGVMLGIAIGEALGYPRAGLSRRTSLRKYGRPTLRYQFVPNKGVYAENTRLAFLHAQALLNSRNEMRNFRPAFRWRLSWYLLSFPSTIRTSILRAGFRSWLMRLKLESGVDSRDSGCATRAVFSAPAMSGCGHRLPKWSDEITKLTHTSKIALQCCRILGTLSDYACTHPEDLDPDTALQAAIDVCEIAEVKDEMQKLSTPLSERQRVSKVARSLGYQVIGDDLIPLTVMAAYCWLRNAGTFEQAVLSANRFLGDTATLSAVVGGLAGAHLGVSKLPVEMISRLGGEPHGQEWINAVASRFSHWPHGADDLYMAPAEPSYPMRQIVRNVSVQPWRLWHWVTPW